MRAVDTAKEIVRIASTANLSKDVIDLLEKKAALLADENALLAREKTALANKVAALEIENRQLKTQFQNSPIGGFREIGGLLWKQTANGYDKTPYCPKCSNHPIMFGNPPMITEPMYWQCSQCNLLVNFTERPK